MIFERSRGFEIGIMATSSLVTNRSSEIEAIRKRCLELRSALNDQKRWLEDSKRHLNHCISQKRKKQANYSALRHRIYEQRYKDNLKASQKLQDELNKQVMALEVLRHEDAKNENSIASDKNKTTSEENTTSR